MITFYYRISNPARTCLTTTWSLGMPKPYIDGYVYAVRVDGDELNYIQNRFCNIPQLNYSMPNTDFVFWHGDFALFITDNLGAPGQKTPKTTIIDGKVIDEDGNVIGEQG